MQIATVVGGPYVAAAVGLCGILGSFVTRYSQPAGFGHGVHREGPEELKKFNQKLHSQKLRGLAVRVKNMNSNLKSLLSATEHSDLLNRNLFETDLPQFIGEVSQNFEKGLSHDSKEEDIDDCLRSMVVYCNAQMSLLLLLANVLATFQATGRQTMFIQNLLNDHKADAIQKLGSLSDEKSMAPSSAIPTESGKIWLIFHLRGRLPFYDVVEE